MARGSEASFASSVIDSAGHSLLCLISLTNLFAMEDKVPRGLRTLRNAPKPESTDTLAQLKVEASNVERWWAQPRWKYTKRIYSGGW